MDKIFCFGAGLVLGAVGMLALCKILDDDDSQLTELMDSLTNDEEENEKDEGFVAVKDGDLGKSF